MRGGVRSVQMFGLAVPIFCTGCDGGGGGTGTQSPPPQPDFAISATPSSIA